MDTPSRCRWSKTTSNKKKRPSPQEEGEGRITYLEVRVASARKSPLVHSSNAHYGRISHHGRSGQRNRMQS